MSEQSVSAFCIYVDTLCQGPVPAGRDMKGNPLVYPTRREAELEIADTIMTRIAEFRAGMRDIEDARAVDDYIVEVEVFPDGSITDADGNCFARDNW